MSSSIKRSGRIAVLANGVGCALHPDPVSAAGETLSPSNQARPAHKYLATYGEPLNYPVDAAAWALGVGRSTLWQMIKNGLVETVKIGRRRLIPKEEVHRIKRGTSTLVAPSKTLEEP